MARIKRLLVSPEFFTMLSTGKVEIVADEIPATAQIVKYGVDKARNCFYIMLSDESFEEIKTGDLISDLPSPIFKRLEN